MYTYVHTWLRYVDNPMLPADEAAKIIQKRFRANHFRNHVLWNPATEVGSLWVTAAMEGRLPLNCPHFADAESDNVFVP